MAHPFGTAPLSLARLGSKDAQLAKGGETCAQAVYVLSRTSQPTSLPTWSNRGLSWIHRGGMGLSADVCARAKSDLLPELAFQLSTT